MHIFSNTCLLLRAEVMHFLPAEVAEWPAPLMSCQGSLLHGWSDVAGPLFQAPALTPAGAVHPVSKAVLNRRSPSSFRRGAVNTLSASCSRQLQQQSRVHQKLWVCSSRDTATVCILYSINFNQDASLICVSSDHGTVHIFAAEDPKRNKQSR